MSAAAVIHNSEMKQRKKALEDRISRVAEEVVMLGQINEQQEELSERLYAEWCEVQVKTSELLLHILEKGSEVPEGGHIYTAVLDVLRRDEHRLQQDLIRLSSVHDREDANFKAKRRELEIEKATAEDLLQQHRAAIAQAIDRREQHTVRVQGHKTELVVTRETFKDDILNYARSIFLV
eukprot:TRINITY_DN15218_c0_g1_i1.p1 TRINITY_DN15218_c0_g1~~TRINITY_DN15218_c0_g1_i1.p1  ORF type:complete len:188 (+),score=70.91 TRINITY_DN15218_c0_g1_i1:29-565(+)